VLQAPVGAAQTKPIALNRCLAGFASGKDTRKSRNSHSDQILQENQQTVPQGTAVLTARDQGAITDGRRQLRCLHRSKMEEQP